MSPKLDRTHAPNAKSWIESANTAETHFPIQNLPFGRYSHRRSGDKPRVGVAIGDRILDVLDFAAALKLERLAGEAAAACASSWLNPLVALSPEHATAIRHAIFDALDANTGANARAPASAFVPMDEAQLHMPIQIGDYTDFFCSMHHAVNASRIFKRPEPLRPNYHYLPVGYHGRASSIVVSGTAIRRPFGELPPDGDRPPVYEASRLLDYEVELGMILRGGNKLGETIPIDEAEDAIFGVCLQNDWSARDIQRWESLPLGPFLSKSFATTISQWIVTVDALRPFRIAMEKRGADIPNPPAHLMPAEDDHLTWKIEIEYAMESQSMRAEGKPPVRVGTSRFTDMHWSPKQMVTHHAGNGCNLRPGDLLGSGTISGPESDSMGCLLERTHDGAEPISVGDEKRGYLEDGDRVVMTGLCTRPGARSIGLGACEGLIIPANS